jgi:hypothetical protein
VLLQRFPLRHQIAYFPHQRLMAVDHNLGGITVIVEPGRRDRRFDRLDLFFTGGDPRLEVGNAFLQPFGLALLLLPIGFDAFAIFSRWFRRT